MKLQSFSFGSCQSWSAEAFFNRASFKTEVLLSVDEGMKVSTRVLECRFGESRWLCNQIGPGSQESMLGEKVSGRGGGGGILGR